MPVLEWRQTARADLFALIDYISDHNPDAAQSLKNEIETKALHLLAYPKSCRMGRVAGTRELVVRGNYILIYVEDARAVTILRVLHAAQQWPPAVGEVDEAAIGDEGDGED
ncbi:type II toxin-antitoxin system RelE/ParE family toxin [Rhizobium sp. SGZ-381]|uniref:type II toxin-antitoxin system RelE/ParE family toxin n=1 Tax=Rhizobium sp. SGZ-381 TaxID=3342800 RepID=UPI003672D25F